MVGVASKLLSLLSLRSLFGKLYISGPYAVDLHTMDNVQLFWIGKYYMYERAWVNE